VLVKAKLKKTMTYDITMFFEDLESERSFVARDPLDDWAATGCCNRGDEGGACAWALPFLAFFTLSSSCSDGMQGIPSVGAESSMLDKTSISESLANTK
jgi:hypothetical protein